VPGLRQKVPALRAAQAIRSQRVSAKASHSAQRSMATLYHQSDKEITQGMGKIPLVQASPGRVS